jgi:DeoR family ulaG and ulaABCDEF operon transcriptional repressor
MENHARYKRLLKLLAEHGSASVSELAQWLAVSPSTIRRDMRLLDLSGQIVRVHGGGKRIDVRRAVTRKGGSFQDEFQRYPERKRAIARYAASMCSDGETILVGGGTTTCGMTEFLEDRRMRILTNSFEVARILLATSENEVILSGGKIYAEEKLILSPFDTEAIQYCYADKLFLGVHGLSALGVMEADPLLVQAGRRLIGQAQQIVVLADSSKFGNKGGMFLCGLDRVSTVVTDSHVPDHAVQMLERAGIDLRIVDPDSFRGVESADAIAAARAADRSSPATPAPH